MEDAELVEDEDSKRARFAFPCVVFVIFQAIRLSLIQRQVIDSIELEAACIAVASVALAFAFATEEWPLILIRATCLAFIFAGVSWPMALFLTHSEVRDYAVGVSFGIVQLGLPEIAIGLTLWAATPIYVYFAD